MHPVKKFILAQLCDYDCRKYSQLKPTSMEPARFMYHLHALIQEDMVNKNGTEYSLTAAGKKYVDKADIDKLEPMDFPRVTVALLYKHTTKGLLLLERPQQPARGVVGFILENVPHDIESLQGFATEKFAALFGVTQTFSHRADGYIRLYDSDQFIANMLTHIMYAEGDTEPNLSEGYLWQSDIAQQPVFTSCTQIINMLEEKSSGEHFFFEMEARY